MILGPVVGALLLLLALWWGLVRYQRSKRPFPEDKSELADPSKPLSLNSLITKMEELNKMEENPNDNGDL